jgi:hypothetical protein
MMGIDSRTHFLPDKTSSVTFFFNSSSPSHSCTAVKLIAMPAMFPSLKLKSVMFIILLATISSAYLEASGGGSSKLLSNDHVVEVVELLAVDCSVHEIPSVKMFAGAQAHGEYAVVRHLVDQLLTDLFSIQVSHIVNRLN